MKKFVTMLAIAVFAVAANAFAGGDKTDAAKGNLGNPGVAPPDSMPYGKSYSQWSTEWWLYCMPKTLDVLPFAGGTDGTVGQSGRVWFLGGTFTGDNLIRTITIPAGTALFFPIRNCECSTLESGDWHGDDEPSLRACANGWIENYCLKGLWGTLDCIIDGVPMKNVEQYRCETRLMSITLPAMESNLFSVPTTEPTPVLSVGDGLYAFLYPLPVGTHTLEFGGVQYTVTVSPR
jgi:hypothetical protein